MTKVFRWAAAALALAIAATATATAAPRGFDAAVFAELNVFRSDPAGYADVLRTYRKRFDGKLLIGEGDEINILTNEGVAAVDEAIRALRPATPLSRLAHGDILARAAADHVADQSRSGGLGHYTDGRGPGDRVVARGGGPYVGEIITYGHHSPASVIHQFLIDDGVPGRGHRVQLLRESYRFAGVACGRHPAHRTMCVIVLSATANGLPPLQPLPKPPRARPR